MEDLTALWSPRGLKHPLQKTIFLSLADRVFDPFRNVLLSWAVRVDIFGKLHSLTDVVDQSLVHRLVHRNLGACVLVNAGKDLLKAVLESVGLSNEIRFA